MYNMKEPYIIMNIYEVSLCYIRKKYYAVISYAANTTVICLNDYRSWLFELSKASLQLAQQWFETNDLLRWIQERLEK